MHEASSAGWDLFGPRDIDGVIPPNDPLIARAKSLELDTPYVPPPGDPLAHHAASYAKVMCSAVFMTGLAPEFAAENVGFFHVTRPSGVTRTAKYLGSQGCVTLTPSGNRRSPWAR